jgi:uncharacterized protein (TIGR03086 family)
MSTTTEAATDTYDRTVFLPVPPDEAFALVTEPARLRRWQSISAQVDLRAGGGYRWTVVPGHVAAGTFREIEPGRRVVLGWGWEGNPALGPDASTVTITLEPTEGGTALRLVHEGLTTEQAASHAEGWDHYLERLERLATEGDVGPDEWTAVPQEMNPVTASDASLAVLLRVLRRLTEADQTSPTPCEGWDAHDLAEHLYPSLAVLGKMAGREIPRPEGGTLEDQIATYGSATIDAWRDRGVEGSVPGPGGGEMPAEVAASILPLELLVHAWDFAQACGQELGASDELASYVLDRARVVITPAVRDGGSFGPEVPLVREHTPLEALIAFSGRSLPA